MDDQEQQLVRELRGFRRGRAPILLAFGANVLLSALLLGVPYLRGHEQALASKTAFVRFAACLFDAKPAPNPGLSLPAGERMRFASRVLSDSTDFLARCDTQLSAIAPEEAIFLWPAVKTAGADVREGVRRLQDELNSLRKRSPRTLDAVPERPLLVLGRLRAALSLLLQAGNAGTDIDRDAIAWVQERPIDPVRLPLTAAQWAPTEAWNHEGYLEASAADARGLSWLRLEHGGLKRRRPRRTSLVRGTLRTAQGLQVVWATPESRCETLDDHCAHHATGIAAYDEDSDQLPQPRWLSGHPLGRIDRSLRLQPQRGTLLARTTEPHQVALRTFQLETLSDGDKPLPASEEWIIETESPVIAASLLPAESAVVAWLWTKDSTGKQLKGYASSPPASQAQEVATIEGEQAFAHGCMTQGTLFVLLGSDRELRLLRHDDGSTTTEENAGDAPQTGTAWLPVWSQAVALKLPLLGEHAQTDAAQLLCDEGRVAIVYRDVQKRLWSTRCDGQSCKDPVQKSTHAATYAALLDGDNLWIATSRTTDSQIRLRHNEHAETTAAPCFEPRAGLCGQPILLTLGSNLVVAAREHSDLLAVMSADGGKTFGPLPGLQDTVLPSDNSALHQHRVRKGMLSH